MTNMSPGMTRIIPRHPDGITRNRVIHPGKPPCHQGAAVPGYERVGFSAQHWALPQAIQ